MTASASTRLTDFSGVVPSVGTLGVAAGILLLKGTIVTLDAVGRGDVVTNGQNAAGVAKHTIDNTSGAAGAEDVEVQYGVHGFAISGTTPLPQQILYIVDNQTVSVDSNGGLRGIAGICVEVRADQAGVNQAYVWMGPNAVAAAVMASSIRIPIPLGAMRLASGAAIPAFNDGVADGFALVSSEGFGIRSNDGTSDVFWASGVHLPDDLDTNQTVTLHILAARIGSADPTAVIDVTAFEAVDGALITAGSDKIAASTSAFDGATLEVQEKTLTINSPTAGSSLSISMAWDAALDADDAVILAAWIEGKRLTA